MAYYGGGGERGGGGGGGGGDQDHFFGHHGRERMVFDGKRMRKPIQRKTVDFNSTVIQHLKVPFYSL